MPVISRAIAVSLTLFAGSVFGEVKVFENFTLIDGTGKAPAARQAMIVENGRIQWVGPEAQVKKPAGAESIDLSGKFVMPGIINLHGHIGNTIDLTQDAKYFTRENIEKNLKTYAMYGVTTAVSMGTDQNLIFKIRDEQRAPDKGAGRPSMTRVYTVGEGFVYKGSYGGLAGVNRPVATAAEVEARLNELAAEKVDLVKFWMDDHMGTFKIRKPHEIGKAIIDGAHRRGLRVTAHVFYLEDAQHLADYGVNAFAHNIRDKPVNAALIDSMKKHGTWLQAATLSREASQFVYASQAPFATMPFFTRGVSQNVVNTLKDPKYQKSIRDDPEFERYRPIFEMAKKNLKALADAGIRYGFGTDTGPPGRFPGYFEQWEMQLMVEAGLTPMQVIVAATKSGAEFLEAKDLGTLEPSKWADMIVLDKSPVENIKNAETIQAVYIAGNRVN